jgi:corrinoid protein of di/trimethylamine methyltransferase
MSEEIVPNLKQAVIEGDEEKVSGYAQKAIEIGYDLPEALENGLAEGITEVGNRWIREEVFLTEVLLSAKAMETGLKILQREMEKAGKVRETLGKVVLGTVKGDIHNLGKNIVAALLKAAGFEVHDIGVDVPVERFVQTVEEVEPDVLGLSSLMTITIPEQRQIIEALTRVGIRERVKVIVGGAPVTGEWAEEIGADGYGRDAISAVKLVKELLGV